MYLKTGAHMEGINNLRTALMGCSVYLRKRFQVVFLEEIDLYYIYLVGAQKIFKSLHIQMAVEQYASLKERQRLIMRINILKEAQIAMYPAVLREIGSQRHSGLVDTTGRLRRTIETIDGQ
jgi:hypothetical protein